MLHILGLCAVVVLGVVMTINAAFMLISPRAWFRLPRWLGKTGSLTEKKYSTGWGAVQVRLAGAAGLAVIAWVLYDILSKHGFRPPEGELALRVVSLCIVAIVAVVMTINGAFMLASPRAWFRLPRWLRAEGSFSEDKCSSGWGAVLVRLTGALILAILPLFGWALYEMFLKRA